MVKKRKKNFKNSAVEKRVSSISSAESATESPTKTQCKLKSRAWLKRITSIQSISFIVAVFAAFAAIFAAYYTYKAYISNEPSQLSIEYPINKENNINLGKRTSLITLLKSDGRCLFFGRGVPDGNYPTGIPRIVNNSNKSLMNFKCEVKIYHWDLDYNEVDIDKDYEVVEDLRGCLKLRYKFDVLNAQWGLPVPLRNAYLSEETIIKEWIKFCLFFEYHISYDGISEPLNYTATIWSYFEEKDCFKEHIDNFLDVMYGNLTKPNAGCLVAISGITQKTTHGIIVDPTKKMNKAEFQEYKKQVIRDYHNSFKPNEE